MSRHNDVSRSLSWLGRPRHLILQKADKLKLLQQRKYVDDQTGRLKKPFCELEELVQATKPDTHKEIPQLTYALKNTSGKEMVFGGSTFWLQTYSELRAKIITAMRRSVTMITYGTKCSSILLQARTGQLLGYWAYVAGLPGVNAQVNCTCTADAVDNNTPNYGSVLTSGIQDISAVAALLGTEACAQHVADGLVDGYLYPAASGLSMFGSLGLVKAAASYIISSDWLKNMGMEPIGTLHRAVGWTGPSTLERKLISDEAAEKRMRFRIVSVNYELLSNWLTSHAIACSLGLLGYAGFILPTVQQPRSIYVIFPAIRVLSSCLISLLLPWMELQIIAETNRMAKQVMRVVLAVACAGVAVGYVGSYVFIQQFSTPAVLYVWLACEVVLMLTRMALWGWNPKWDDLRNLFCAIECDHGYLQYPHLPDNGDELHEEKHLFFEDAKILHWRLVHAGLNKSALLRLIEAVNLNLKPEDMQATSVTIGGRPTVLYVDGFEHQGLNEQEDKRNIIWIQDGRPLCLPAQYVGSGIYKLDNEKPAEFHRVERPGGASETIQTLDLLRRERRVRLKQETVCLGLTAEATITTGEGKPGSFVKLNDALQSCGCVLCAKGWVLYAANSPREENEVKNAVKVFSGLHPHYKESRFKWFKVTSLFVNEEAYFELWNEYFPATLSENEVLAAILLDLTRVYWLKCGICVSSTSNMEGLVEKFKQNSLKAKGLKHEDEPWPKDSIVSWLSFVVYDPKVGDYTGQNHREKLESWARELPAAARLLLMWPSDNQCIHDVAIEWFVTAASVLKTYAVQGHISKQTQ
ncbi:hypothetical protein NQZ79_g8185 [Umbelopsis isabellina]|nr:hypothetical protein NQZ79_g8185 [Umbelopsis isabellina]